MKISPHRFHRIFMLIVRTFADKIGTMGMNIGILRDSFEAIKPVAGKVVDHFYGVLFTDYPGAQTLFRPERMEKQKSALIQSLVIIFENLEKPEKLKNYLAPLGIRHLKYGAKPEHYDWVAESLLKTLQYFFDNTWTPELEESWMIALGTVGEIMRSAAITHAKQVQNLPQKFTETSMKEDIERVLKELMRETILELVESGEIKDIARSQAKSLIKDSLQQQLLELKEQFKTKKAA